MSYYIKIGSNLFNTICLLGAEKQAASSLAIAYPGINFYFLSDQKIIDGWNIKNASVHFATQENITEEYCNKFLRVLVLHPKWLLKFLKEPSNIIQSFNLMNVMFEFAKILPEQVLPISDKLLPGMNIVKGNLFHRPDETSMVHQSAKSFVQDPHNAGIVYQPFLEKTNTINIIGYRKNKNTIGLGIFQIFKESICRDEYLLAAESIMNEKLIDWTLMLLNAIDHCGFFNFNWLQQKNTFYLSSFRPVPKAIFNTFINSGIDLLNSNESIKILPAGKKFISSIHYTSYRALHG